MAADVISTLGMGVKDYALLCLTLALSFSLQVHSLASSQTGDQLHAQRLSLLSSRLD